MAEPPPDFSKVAQKTAPPPEPDQAEDPPPGPAANEPPPSDDTRELQRLLRAAGYEVAEDGRYDRATAEAVRSFQKASGLPADGVVGPQTMDALSRSVTAVPTAADATPPTPVPLPLVAFLRADDDRADVERITGAIAALADEARPDAVAVRRLEEIPPETVERLGLVVVCLSPALLTLPPDADPLDWLLGPERPDAPVVRVSLAPFVPGEASFADLRALGGGLALRTAREPGAWVRSVADEIVALVRDARPRSYLPRFSADDLGGQELLERRGKIEFIASVLAAKQLETPLAIGLFGDWGSGKSFFMDKLQKRIVTLTEASAAVKEGERSLYCSHVRHVNFNAWLHSGAPDLWPAFAAEVFRGVSDPETRDEQGTMQRDDLIGFRQQLAAAEDRKQRIRELEDEIEAKSGELHGLEPDAGAATRLVGTFREIGARLVGLRHGWRDLRAADVLLLVSIGIAVAAFAVFETPLAWIAAGATGLLAVLRYLDEARKLRGLEAELAAEKKEQATYEEGVAVAVPPELLPDFARKEAADWAQRAQFDSVTEIRMKFDRLSKLIADGLAAPAGPGGNAKDAVPIERVIVYVDDLDRCQYRVVVSVLETLKLLLSLPHFVAVVGVDSRWLFRSLELHFRELLHTDDGASQDAAWAATPQNYLEKIFQYSVVLKPISEAGFANLIESLLAAPEPDDGAAGAAARHDPGPGGREAEGGDGVEPSGEPPAGTPPAGASTAVEPTEAPDLTPVELVITPEEIAFIQGLAPLFETPRAAKRLANVYRLMRVSVGADRLLRDEGYEPALLLLAIGIGFPGLAGEVFDAIGRHSATSWPAFVEGLPADDDAHRKLKDRLGRASPGHVADRDLASFGPWIADVAEFSFHPWQELLPAATKA